MSRVDVIVPCYKYGHYLRGCVASVLSQSVKDTRVFIIDDCSPDNTAAVAEELAREDSRVEFRRHPTNRGHIATYNEGLAWAAGDFTLLLSADDMLAPDALRRATHFMDSHPDVSLVYGNSVRFQTDEVAPTVSPPSEGFNSEVITGPAFLEAACLNGYNPIGNPASVLVRTALQRRLGGYHQELPHSGDLEMWLRFAVYTPVGVLDVDQALYRRHPENMSNGYLQTTLADLRQRKAAFDTLFRHHGAAINDCARLQSLVTRVLAMNALWDGSKAFDQGDNDACEQCLNFALALHPPLRSSPEWSRLRAKRLVGAKAWSVIRPFVEWARASKPGRKLPEQSNS